MQEVAQQVRTNLICVRGQDSRFSAVNTPLSTARRAAPHQISTRYKPQRADVQDVAVAEDDWLPSRDMHAEKRAAPLLTYPTLLELLLPESCDGRPCAHVHILHIVEHTCQDIFTQEKRKIHFMSDEKEQRRLYICLGCRCFVHQVYVCCEIHNKSSCDRRMTRVGALLPLADIYKHVWGPPTNKNNTSTCHALEQHQAPTTKMAPWVPGRQYISAVLMPVGIPCMVRVAVHSLPIWLSRERMLAKSGVIETQPALLASSYFTTTALTNRDQDAPIGA